MDILGCILLIVIILAIFTIITADEVDIRISIDEKEIFKYVKKNDDNKNAPDEKKLMRFLIRKIIKNTWFSVSFAFIIYL